ncbi:DUF3298 and DUF4163 domain-containing protein [Pseudodesulfovibrio sediminis]|uniref:DUF3298 domain-containing protein n=1 Tax=Pseudodesulfovibrio sediminis TaxID=2810563 RepID=A0ABM7P4T7_9BACT|nr:DUF3298 and DUF4163 domain-containing protein [Pseudodesulfovibrio sediminis]BCS87907.1 hypothetical protein PSDVSF_11490 [Pseudodesulfovibrio sediminis]
MHRMFALLTTLCIVLVAAAPLSAAPCTPLVLSSVTIREETLGFTVDAEYPVLCVPEANRTIRDWVGFCLFDFKKLDPEHDLSDFPHKYSLHMHYAVWPSQGHRFVSVKLSVAVYTGGAHSNHWPKTWVFDRENGHVIELGDVFTDLESGLNTVSRLVRPPLVSALGDMYLEDMLQPGIEPMEDNFRNFIFTEDGMTFFFMPYQVAPFAAGEQIVTIPYENIDNLFNAETRHALGRE